MAWGVPLLGAVTETTVTGGNLTLPEHASAADGMLQIAFIAYRDTPAFSPPGSEGWALVATQQSSGDTDTTNGVASAVMYWRVRAGAGTRVFTRTAGNVAQGLILSYPVTAGTVPEYVTGSANTLASVNVTVTTATFNTSTDGELIVCGCSVGDNFNVSAFDAATDPTTASGATDTTTAPTAGTWLERVDVGTNTGADSGISVADAIRATAGATGTIQCTSASACRSAMVAGCFKMVAGPQTVNATAGTLTLAAQACSIALGAVTVAATAAALGLTVPDATVTAPPSGQTVNATAAAVTLTAADATVTPGAVTIQATSGGLTLTIPAVTVTRTHVTKIELLEGSTVRATWYEVPTAGSVTSYDFTITTAELDTITDWGALRVRVTATGDVDQTRVTDIILTLPEGVATQTVFATAAGLTLTVPAASISTGPVTVQATAAALGLSVPDAAIAAGGITLQATDAALTLAVPDAIITLGGQTIQATAAMLSLAAQAATLTPGGVTVPATHAPLALSLAPTTITVGPITLAASWAELLFTVPDAVVSAGSEQTVTATAAGLTLTISTPTVTQVNYIVELAGSRFRVDLEHAPGIQHPPRVHGTRTRVDLEAAS